MQLNHQSTYRSWPGARSGMIRWIILLVSLLASFAAMTATGTGAHADSVGRFPFYWNTDGSPTWDSSAIAGGSSADSAPAIVHNTNLNNEEVAVEGPNNSLDYYWAHDGSPTSAPTWDMAVIAGAGTTYSAPAIVHHDYLEFTVVAVEGANGSLSSYWDEDRGGAPWFLSVIAGAGTTTSAPAMVYNNNYRQIEVAARGPVDSLDYYWAQESGPSPWSKTVVPEIDFASALSAPAIVYNDYLNNTEIAVGGPAESVYYYWKYVGSSTWSSSVIGPSAYNTYSAPAMVYNDYLHNTEVVTGGPN